MENVEELAKAMGHVPKEEWDEDRRGPWKSPEEYVELAQNKLPVARKNLEKMAKDIMEFKTELKSMGRLLKASEQSAMEAEKKGYEKAKQEYNMQLASLRDEYRAAAKDQDEGRMASIERRMDRLEPPEPPSQSPPGDNGGGPSDGQDPEFESFKARSDYYLKDPEMTYYADTVVANFLEKNFSNLKGTRAWYDKADELVKAKFPNRSGGSPPPGPEGGGGEPPPRTPKKRTFDALPREAQEECDRQIEMGYIKDRKRYVELYYMMEDRANERV